MSEKAAALADEIARQIESARSACGQTEYVRVSLGSEEWPDVLAVLRLFGTAEAQLTEADRKTGVAWEAAMAFKAERDAAERQLSEVTDPFAAVNAEQERLVIDFCAEIAGQDGQPARPPDPIRLLEMAEALYRAGMGEKVGGVDG